MNTGKGKSIPNHLRIKDRLADNSFDDLEEWLYRRVKPDWWLPDTDTLDQLVSLPRTSVARGRYCQCSEDVLYTSNSEFPEGVVGWQVGKIPQKIEDGKNQTFLRLTHCPEDDFYPHSEIQTLKALNDKAPSKPGNKSFRKLVRWNLGKIAVLITRPSQPPQQS